MVGSVAGSFSYEVVSTLPTASASTMGIIYVVPSGNTSTMNLTVETDGSYSWEQIGATESSLETITDSEIDDLFES